MNKKGFTLTEIILVLAVLGVLGVLIMPMLSGFINPAEQLTCQRNRAGIIQNFQTEKIYDPSLTLGEFIANEANICPSHGLINVSVSGRSLVCSKHGSIAETAFIPTVQPLLHQRLWNVLALQPKHLISLD